MDAGFILAVLGINTEVTDEVAILLSMDAGFIYSITKFTKNRVKKSQSYFQWMRVSYINWYTNLSHKKSRNPTFNGCGFHIKIK